MKQETQFAEKHQKLMTEWKCRLEAEYQANTFAEFENSKRLEYFTTDGIIDPDTWFSDNGKRVLFLLKEAYCSDGYGDWSEVAWLNGKHCRQICPKRNADVSDLAPCPIKWNSFNRIVEWNYYIVDCHRKNNSIDSNVIDFVYWLGEKNCSTKKKDNLAAYRIKRERLLKRIAVVNIKKSNGCSSSDNRVIRKHAKVCENLLMQQIALISPDYIICCGTWHLLTDELQNYIKRKYDKVLCLDHPNRISVEKGINQINLQLEDE